MLEYLTLGVIIFFCFFIKKDIYILYLFLILIPFHSFIKSCFTYFLGGGEIFSIWKEVVILILIFKTIGKPSLKLDKQLILVLSIFVFVVFCYFLVTDDLEIALPTFRDHLFPLLFFVLIAKMKLVDSNLTIIIRIVLLTILLTDLFGILQHFFFNEQLSQIMGRIDFMDSSGYIQYNTNSARIMGYERMAGIIGGGPNMFGVFNGFSIVFLYGILTNQNKSIISKKLKKVIIVTLIISLGCIILSFSRAGWVIALVGTCILLFLNKKINKLKYFAVLSLTSFLIAFCVFSYIPKVGDIVYDSLTGKEESASKRSDMITELIPAILNEPFGHGIGTTDNRSKTKLFFAESAFTNIAFEIGVLGLLYLIWMHLRILEQIYRTLNWNYFSKIAFALGVVSLIVSFVSVNPYGMPYIYLWWFILGIGINKSNLLISRLSKASFVRIDNS